MGMNDKKIGALIYQLRTEKKLTQKQLAAALHVSDKAISKWERGSGCPDISLIPMIGKVFDVNIEYLLCGDLKEKNIPLLDQVIEDNQTGDKKVKKRKKYDVKRISRG